MFLSAAFGTAISAPSVRVLNISSVHWARRLITHPPSVDWSVNQNLPDSETDFLITLYISFSLEHGETFPVPMIKGGVGVPTTNKQ